jgi:hypothetical protein
MKQKFAWLLLLAAITYQNAFAQPVIKKQRTIGVAQLIT